MFQNCTVPIPILSIRGTAKKRARATFWDGGGELVLRNGTILPIVERMGVYFIKLTLDRPTAKDKSSDFMLLG